MHANAAHPAAPGRARAAAMVLAATALWGLSGVAAQALMQRHGVGAAWLVSLRMATAAVALFAVALGRLGPAALWAPWRARADRLRLVAFAVVGLFAVQYTYLMAILVANAAAATFLQYLGSALVVAWIAVGRRRRPHPRLLVALAVALGGIALVATNGSLGALAVPPAGIAWGLGAAVALAFNTVLPAPLLRRHGTLPTVAWGMLLGAATAIIALRPPLAPRGVAGPEALALVAFVAVLGTAVPFALYMGAIRRLPPAEAALFANAEPVAAALAAALWLDVRLGAWALVGGALVLAATTDLYRRPVVDPEPPAPPSTAPVPVDADRARSLATRR
jgi:drug/metabolite transporter (DMT)-like permease